jgi:hypothetical protein
MRRIFLAILFCFTLLCQSVLVYAGDSKMIFTDIKYYSAKIFVCDTKNTEAILLNVVPLSSGYSLNAVKDIEYTALPITEKRIYGTKGQVVPMSVVNGYLLDSPVKVMIGKNGYGYKILQMELLR